MHRIILAAAVLLAFTFLAALHAFAQNENKKDVDKKPSEWVRAGVITGKVVSVEESKRSLRISTGRRTVNPVAMASYQQAQKALRAARTKDEKLNALQEMQAAQKNLVANDVELQTIDEVVVRVPQPKADFDEKGKIKKLTAKEKKELKGNPRLPGYIGEFANVRQNQYVEVHLVKRREAPQAAGRKARDADVSMAADNLPMAQMIVILRDLPN